MTTLSARSPWLIAIGLCLGPAVSNGLARFAYGLVLPAMKQDLGWTYTQAGWINTANAIGYLVGALLALGVIRTLGPQRLFIGGIVLTAFALVASGLTRDFWLLSLCRILAGIGGAPALIAGSAMVSSLFKGDAARNSMAIAVYFGGGGIGMLLTGVSIPFILERWGSSSWPVTWLLLGSLGVIAILPAVLAAKAVAFSSQSHGGASHVPLPVRSMLPALLSYFLFAVGYIVYLTFVVAWMRNAGASTLLVAATWGLLGAAVTVSPFAWRRRLTLATGGGALALACAATGIGTMLPLIIPGGIGLLLSAAIFGGSFFIGPASVTAFSRKNLPQAQWGHSVALFTTVFAVGQTLGPVAAGSLADATKSLASGLLAAGLTLLAAGAIAGLQGELRPGAE